MKSVTIISSNTNEPKTINTSATTWAELQADLTSNQIQFSGMKAMVRETRVNLEASNAVLPTGSFTLFLTPGKIKSGN